MRTSRDVSLTIGKGIYTIHTPLENEEIDRLKALIDEACGEIVKGAKQEDMLMLTCLKLAYSLDSVNEKLRKILEKIDGERL
ncbi:MAG: cell division protein ZapA [Synergistaceae bacterium]|nr:cell division protein ZapA [Synergistaceae bacterium]MBQ3347166.1 cell division protein ZapA [Synergistaceae bacterium]MBQ3397605.1 cell division protein ZapA [Synergistaceae bacterium]MBQ3757949.1 cell division protein ZapA [Synergistaceae bacterium]MBQ4402413.1 cell division protein ZapA [Synergistaceae bacterium]